MQKKTILKSLRVIVGSFFIVGLFGVFSSTDAKPFSIENCTTANVTNSLACEWVNGRNDMNDHPLGILGGDWLFLEKSEQGDSRTNFDIGLIVDPVPNGANSQGSWSIDGWHSFEDLMIVLKAGNGYIGYQLADKEISGTWNTGDINNKGLSHLSIYGRDEVPVPEPATLLLFGTGIAGLAGAGLRKRKK